MKTKLNYKPPDIDSGELRTPVTFFEYGDSDGPEPGQQEKEKLHFCYAKIYNPSMKDMEVMRTAGTKEGITLNIRDAGKDYIPTNKHFFEIDDYRYEGKAFEIIDVAPDMQNNRFVKIIGGYTS